MLPGFRPTTSYQLQKELERQAIALEQNILHLRALLSKESLEARQVHLVLAVQLLPEGAVPRQSCTGPVSGASECCQP